MDNDSMISSGSLALWLAAPRASSSPAASGLAAINGFRGTKEPRRRAARYRLGEARPARRPTGRATDAIVPAYSLQSAEYDSRPDRVGPGAGAVDGNPARRQAALGDAC